MAENLVGIKKFVQDLPKMHQDIKNLKMGVGDLEHYKELFEQYAYHVTETEFDELEKEYKETLEDFIMLCMDYYVYSTEGDVLISDHMYDLVMGVYHQYSGKVLVYADYISTDTMWPFRTHEAPFMVGSVKKIYDYDELKEWLKKSYTYGYRKILYAPKYDGVSAVIKLADNRIELAMTRNDGIQGQDITEVIRRCEFAKKIFKPYMPDGWYKCELVVTRADFDKLIQIKEYSNRRSATSGLVNTPSNLEYAQYLTPIPLAWCDLEGKKMKYLAGDFVGAMIKNPFSFTIDDVYENIDFVLKVIRDADYPVRTDGVVLFPVMEGDWSVPNTTDLMADAIAFKVNTEEAYTTAEYVYISVGRLGKAIPMVHVHPVEVNETTVKDVSLGSVDKYASMGLHENEKLIVYSAGNVIPQVKLPDPREYPKKSPKFKLDLRCPYCGKELKRETAGGRIWMCMNKKCAHVLAGRISNFLAKVDLKGFSDSTFDQLFEAGVIKNIEDVFAIPDRINEIARLDGFGITSATQLAEAVQTVMETPIEVSQVIGALGINKVSTKKCQIIFQAYNIEELLSMSRSKIYRALLNLDGIGDSIAHNVAYYIDDNRDSIKKILSKMNVVNDVAAKGNVVFTGFRNEAYAQIFKSIGYPTSDTVNSNTVCVIYAGDTDTGKCRQARRKGINMVHVAQIDDLVTHLKGRTRDDDDEF